MAVAELLEQLAVFARRPHALGQGEVQVAQAAVFELFVANTPVAGSDPTVAAAGQDRRQIVGVMEIRPPAARRRGRRSPRFSIYSVRSFHEGRDVFSKSEDKR